MLFLRFTALAHAILRALTSRKAQCLVFVAFLCCWVNSERVSKGSTVWREWSWLWDSWVCSWVGKYLMWPWIFFYKKTGKIKNKGREMVIRESSHRLSWDPRLGEGQRSHQRHVHGGNKTKVWCKPIHYTFGWLWLGGLVWDDGFVDQLWNASGVHVALVQQAMVGNLGVTSILASKRK